MDFWSYCFTQVTVRMYMQLLPYTEIMNTPVSMSINKLWQIQKTHDYDLRDANKKAVTLKMTVMVVPSIHASMVNVLFFCLFLFWDQRMWQYKYWWQCNTTRVHCQNVHMRTRLLSRWTNELVNMSLFPMVMAFHTVVLTSLVPKMATLLFVMKKLQVSIP